MRFHDRRQAGIRLGAALDRFRGDDLVVVGLPRGGVPVAHEVAEALGAPLGPRPTRLRVAVRSTGGLRPGLHGVSRRPFGHIYRDSVGFTA